MGHKLGIIGYGGMACWHHDNSKRVDDFEVVAAFDIAQDRRDLAASKGLTAYDNLADFLADKRFDLVLVATPNNFHKEMTIAALEAGYNVICEKPVAMSVAELDEMIATSERVGKLFTVHQNRRWDKDFNIVKKAIQENMLGKPYSIESRVHGQNGVMHGWRAYKVAGGGMLLDWGVHLLDQIMWLVNEPVKEVYANLHMIKTPEVDDYFKAILRFESGLSAQVEVGTYTLIRQPRWYAYGDAGALIINDWDCSGHVIRAKDHVLEWEQEVVQTSAGPTRSMAPRPKETLEEFPLPEINTEWAELYRNVLATIDGKAELIVKPSQVKRVLTVIEAIFKSDETGEAIKVNI